MKHDGKKKLRPRRICPMIYEVLHYSYGKLRYIQKLSNVQRSGLEAFLNGRLPTGMIFTLSPLSSSGLQIRLHATPINTSPILVSGRLSNEGPRFLALNIGTKGSYTASRVFESFEDNAARE